MELINYIRNHSSPLEQIETGETAKLTAFKGIRGIVFDIYGTLIISAAGDISLAGGETAPAHAMKKALTVMGCPEQNPELILDHYYKHIKRHQETRKQEGIEYPEVEIREIWRELLIEMGGDPAKAEAGAIAYECAANPVWPMDKLSECLTSLREKDMALGIVSNAQFYTPLLFPALTNNNLDQWGFCHDLMVYSYEMREGKPSRNLYSTLAKNLSKRGISPSEILYVGNDRLKDIWPAQLEGFKTVFFAGDQRSHRWRPEDPRLEGVEPDAVITHLSQIDKLIPNVC